MLNEQLTLSGGNLQEISGNFVDGHNTPQPCGRDGDFRFSDSEASIGIQETLEQWGLPPIYATDLEPYIAVKVILAENVVAIDGNRDIVDLNVRTVYRSFLNAMLEYVAPEYLNDPSRLMSLLAAGYVYAFFNFQECDTSSEELIQSVIDDSGEYLLDMYREVRKRRLQMHRNELVANSLDIEEIQEMLDPEFDLDLEQCGYGDFRFSPIQGDKGVQRTLRDNNMAPVYRTDLPEFKLVKIIAAHNIDKTEELREQYHTTARTVFYSLVDLIGQWIAPEYLASDERMERLYTAAWVYAAMKGINDVRITSHEATLQEHSNDAMKVLNTRDTYLNLA